MLQETNQVENDNHLIQIKVRALLLDLVYQTTTIEYLLKHNVTNLHDWHWLQQLKFYLGDKDNQVRVKMVYAIFEYSYEFLGNFNKLVYTSLAHNCYLTLTQVKRDRVIETILVFSMYNINLKLLSSASSWVKPKTMV